MHDLPRAGPLSPLFSAVLTRANGLAQFILGSGRLHAAALEDCFPYTLLRTNYIQIYQKQSTTGG